MFLRIAIKSLLNRKGSVVMSLLAIAVAIFVLLGIEHIRNQARDSFASTVSGVDLIQAAKKDVFLRSIPVLAVTAFAAKGDEERIRAAGASGYLAKPVSISPFMSAVKELVEA